MIYINKVITSNPMKEIKVERDFEFFKECKSQRLPYPANEEMEKQIKGYQMNIIIAGTMVGDLKRNNKNVFSRSLLFIDFDNVNETEQDFLDKLVKRLDDVNYVLYPTLKYKPIENIRYRLVLELDRPVNTKEYEILLFGFSKELGVDYVPDTSNKTWSQGQGVPVVTEYSENVKSLYHDGFKAIPVDKFIKHITSTKEYREALKTQNTGFSDGQSFKLNTGGQKYTGEFLQQLFDGAVQGERNTWWRIMTDKMLAVDTPIETIQKIMEVVNFNTMIFPEPLPMDELEKVYLSRIKNHVEKGGRLF